MEDTDVDVVAGAFSYTGGYLASRLLDAGRKVRTLTAHPSHEHPLAGRIEVVPFGSNSPSELARSLYGATTFYNTYWVRFPRGDTTFHDAVANSRALFEAAKRAGVESASMTGNHVLNEVGPDIFTFEEMVRVVRGAVGGHARLLHVPAATVPTLIFLAAPTLPNSVATSEIH